MKTKRRFKSKRKQKNNRKTRGGKAVAAGGFGCVFKPALICKHTSHRTPGVSKLMLSRYAQEEMGEYKSVIPILQSIPNYADYFLIDNVNICKPRPLTTSDKVNFNSKCSNLTKKGYSEYNVNSKISDFRILNIPDGGVDIDTWFDNMPITVTSFASLNNKLIELLNNAIVPMNKRKLYHFDLKGGNILVDQNTDTRIIDWGLSGISTQSTPIPYVLSSGRPPQFNCPYSNIMFSTDFQDKYTAYINSHFDHFKDFSALSDAEITLLREFVMSYYYKLIKTHEGHHRYNKTLYNNIFSENWLYTASSQLRMEDTYYLFYMHFLIEYIVDVLITFTSNGRFSATSYFEKVYSKNCDVWGFLMCYYPLFEIMHKNPGRIPSRLNMHFFQALQDIFVNYAFTASDQEVNISLLTDDLNGLNLMLGQPATYNRQAAAPMVAPAPTVAPAPMVAPAPIPVQPLGAPPGFTPRASSPTLKKKRKRCPNGTRRNKKTGLCEPKIPIRNVF